MRKFGRIAAKIVLWVMGILLSLALLLFVLIQLPAVQNFVVQKVSAYLEKKIETPFSIGNIRLEFPKMLVIEDLYVEDRSQDTLLAGERLRVDVSMWKLLQNVVEVNRVDLIGVTGKINRTLPDQHFNFQYILDAFVDPNQDPEPLSAAADSTAPLVFSIDRINLERIHVVYQDEVLGLSTDLYLGSLKTRIRTFDLTNNMHFALPKLEVSGLRGHLDQWTSPIPADTTAGTDMPILELDEILLSKIDFAYRNQEMALDSRFSWETLAVRLDELDLNESRVQIDKIALDRSDSHIIFGSLSEESSRQEEIMVASDSSDTGSSWDVRVSQLVINETNFLYRDDNQVRLTKGFDYGNIGIQGLQGELNDFLFSTDGISGSLESLQASDHSGFELKQLRASFIYTDQGAELDQLYAETAHTRLQVYLKIAYPSLESLGNRPGEMDIQADLQNSFLGMQDVLFFLPDLDTMEMVRPLLEHTFHVNGSVNGKLNHLEIPSLQLHTLDQTRLDLNGTIRGLPDMNLLSADLELHEVRTGRQDLDRLLAPGLLPDSIQIPEELLLSGTFNGGLSDLTADLQLETTDGNLSFNGNLQMPAASDLRDTLYQAEIAIMDVNLGQILKQDSLLGLFSFAGSIEGNGLDPKTMTAKISGELIGLEALGYRYHDIQLAAEAVDGEFNAEVESTDTNIDFALQAQADLRGTYPSVWMEMMIDSVNFKNLNLMEEEFRYHGRVVADLETADIDHLNGTVDILNSSIAFKEDRYTFQSINLLARSEETANLIQLTSEFFNAHLVGDYRLSELNHAIQDIVAVYYQPDSIAPSFEYSPQQFDFSARLTRSRFIRDFLPDLTEMRDITLDGSFNSEDKFLLVKANAPKLVYAGTEITAVGLDITTFDSTMYYSALIEQIAINELELTNTLLSGTVLQNQLDFGLWIKDQADVERYHLGVGMRVDAGNFVVSLLENGLMLNYDEWEIDPENAVVFGKDGVHARNIILHQGDQRLMVMSQYENLNAPIDLIFENFRIETFSKMLESELLDMGGGINGLISLSRLESNPIFISDIEIDQFYFGRDTIGNIVMSVNNAQNNTYAAQIDIIGHGNQVSLNGSYLALPNQEPQMDFTLDLEPMTMKTLEAFSLGYLRQSSGDVTGQLQVSGTLSHPRLDGALQFNEAAMNVGMLNANFTVDNQRIVFDHQGIRFDRFELQDSKNNIARLNGSINTTTFRDFAFNLTLNADEFQVLNSTRQDLDIFYGQLYVTSNLRINGGLNNPIINGNLYVDEHTNVTFVLPNDDPGVVERDGIIKFVNRSDTSAINVFARLDSLTTTELGGLQLSMNIQTHESARFSIVIDEGSGDALNIQGTADLTAGIDPSGDITLTGTYTVEDGNYSFTFEPVKREFDFKQGSTITWAGDPMDARLDITAVYHVRAPSLELVQGQIGGGSENLYKQRVPFDVNLDITGQMLQPELHFGIDLDEDNSLISQDVASKVNSALVQLEENESEMNKQVFALIVMGRFMAANPFESVSGGSAGSIARNSVSSLLSAQLNRLAGDLIRGVELDFDLQSGEDFSTGQSLSRTDLNIGVSKMLLDDRLKVTIGSNFELEGNARPGEQTTNIAGDIAVDYQLSKSGRYLLRVYRKNQYQVTLQGQYVETGIGFIINMDYNEFREIFMNSRELADLYSPDTREFQRRFDRDRMQTDSVYRDSVRAVIRDSLQRIGPESQESRRERLPDSTAGQSQTTWTDVKRRGLETNWVVVDRRRLEAIRTERSEHED